MKNFAFKYEKVLQMRIGEENDAKAELASVMKKISDKEEELKITEIENDKFLANINEICKEGTLIKDLQCISSNKKHMKEKLKSIKEELEYLYADREAKKEKFIEASKNKKVMENLKEKEELAHKELIAQNELKVIDEIVTYQSRNKRG